MQSYLVNEGIKWSFIIELAPWMGGLYERLGTCEAVFAKEFCLNTVQLEIILTEVEAVVNS